MAGSLLHGDPADVEAAFFAEEAGGRQGIALVFI
ncbi:Protein of unknown function [Lactobacillus delbrueckii subsp. lactis]|nr:Protein of unknown function [Lactobacillus delbrueckii subsp. lactis]